MLHGKRFQFTLRQMMVAVSATAVACAFFILLVPELWSLAVELASDKAARRALGRAVAGGLVLAMILVAAAGLRFCLTLGRKRSLGQDDDR